MSGEVLSIEDRDSGEVETYPVQADMADWDESQPRVHRGINAGSVPFAEVIMFFIDEPGMDGAAARSGRGNMSLYAFMKLLHVLAAFWMVSGVVGRDLAFWWAGRATDVHAVHALLRASDFFERYAVIPVSMAVLLFGLIVIWMQKWPLLGFLQGSPTNWLFVSFFWHLSIYRPAGTGFPPQGADAHSRRSFNPGDDHPGPGRSAQRQGCEQISRRGAHDYDNDHHPDGYEAVLG